MVSKTMNSDIQATASGFMELKIYYLVLLRTTMYGSQQKRTEQKVQTCNSYVWLKISEFDLFTVKTVETERIIENSGSHQFFTKQYTRSYEAIA